MKSVRLPLFCKIRKEKGNGMSLWLSEKKWMFLNSHCLYEKWGWCVRCELSRWGNVCTKLQVYIGVVVRSNQPLYIVHFFKFLQSALIKVKLNCLLCTSFRSSRRGCMFVAGSNREGFHLKRQPLTLTIYIYIYAWGWPRFAPDPGLHLPARLWHDISAIEMTLSETCYAWRLATPPHVYPISTLTSPSCIAPPNLCV